jgi:hypothetical protein
MMTRRDALRTMGTGFGLLGFANLAQAQSRGPQLPARAKRVVFLFLNGGPSQVDTFDPKPLLERYHGKPAPTGNLETERKTGALMKSPFRFQRYGRSGLEISDLFPQLGAHADDLCIVRSMYTDRPNHEPSLFMMNSGDNFIGHPSMGSWITYGLGTENQNLPGFVVLCPGLPQVGPELWGSAFLPAEFQGVHIPMNERDPDKMIQHIRGLRPPGDQRRDLDLAEALDRLQLRSTGADARLESTIQSMEIAFRMQAEAPDAFDIRKETEQTRARYGDSDFGRGCLTARRLLERGVRMVQVYFGNLQPWDNHDEIQTHRVLAKDADPAVAALLSDLKSSGLFEDTILILGGEFGRTPAVEVSGLVPVQNGRDHNCTGFSMVLAGGGLRRGIAYGATDELGFRAVENPVHVHDLHATILHQLGLDHTRLTYRYSGRDFRLTDVSGQVVNGLLA